MAPSAIVSTDMLEIDLWCDCIQYGGDATGETIGDSLPFGALLEGDVVVLFEPAASPSPLPLLEHSSRADSIHLRAAAPRRRTCEVQHDVGSGIQDGG